MREKQLLREIPQMDKILQNPIFKSTNKAILKRVAVSEIQKFRDEILAGDSGDSKTPKRNNAKSGVVESRARNSKDSQARNSAVRDSISVDSKVRDSVASQVRDSTKAPKSADSSDLLKRISAEYHRITSPSLKPLINATGVVLHTNLGRSVIHENILREITPMLTSYNNLEYDLARGCRGERYSHLSDMFRAIFGAQDALIVNNNAAAVFLILNTFAKDREVIVSRGELIEIGGSFRIPEIMKSAGARLTEIGTTNKTKLNDYKSAINGDSAMILKAHKSNFAMSGFTQEVAMSEISALCGEKNLIDYYDLGSGFVKGIACDEPSLLDIAKNPPSLMSFSGDKLFGGIQAGIILGKVDLIEKLKQNHLLRAFRVDKVTILLLQATLKRYIDENLSEIPSIQMLSLAPSVLESRAKNLANRIDDFYHPRVIALKSLAGGGSLPGVEFESFGVSLSPKFPAITLESALREHYLIARILNDSVVFDMRTIQEREIDAIVGILRDIKAAYE